MERRTQRVSESQWDVLLEFLEQNPNLARGYNNSSQGRRETTRLWQEVAVLLNSQGSGTSKTPKDWSVYISNYKSKLKKIVADNNSDASGTGGGPPRGSSLPDRETRFLSILGPGYGQAAPRVRVDPLPEVILQQPSTSRQSLHMPVDEDNIILEEVYMEPPAESSVQDNLAAPAVISSPPLSPASGAAPPLPRRQRQTRYRSRPLAPLDEARRILSQVEMQRAAADVANARALELIGQNLGRLADVAERYINQSGPQ